MPEEKDMFRIFVPTDEEKDAFAFSSVNLIPLDKPRDKCWKAPGGSKISSQKNRVDFKTLAYKWHGKNKTGNGVAYISSEMARNLARTTLFAMNSKMSGVNPAKLDGIS